MEYDGIYPSLQDALLRSAIWTLADQNSGELKMGYVYYFCSFVSLFVYSFVRFS